jgi:hypothetical protein
MAKLGIVIFLKIIGPTHKFEKNTFVHNVYM